MIKNKDGSLWGQARDDPRVICMTRGDPSPGRYKRSRAPAGGVQCLSFNRLILSDWERYGQRSMNVSG